MQLKMLKLVQSFDPILRQNAELVTRSEFKDIIDISGEMFSIMKANQGVGLAAPQVGVSKRFFIKKCFHPILGFTINSKTQTTIKVNDINNKDYKDYYDLIINPIYIYRSDKKDIMSEGCLSLPSVEVQIERPSLITLSFLCNISTEGNSIMKMAFDGVESRICQHEIDHLDGKLITDYY
jgi:peptide deformylase